MSSLPRPSASRGLCSATLFAVASAILLPAIPGLAQLTAAEEGDPIRGFTLDGKPMKAAPPRAQDERGRTGQVVIVTADRQSISAERSTATTSVIDQEEITEQGNPNTPWQLLQGMPGVDVQQVNSGQTSVRLRGTNGFDTQVLIDGIPLNDATNTQGAADLTGIGGSGLERIEVVRGTQSGLYGSRAIGGVINLLTVRPTENPEGKALVEGGSDVSLRADGSATGQIGGGFGYAVSAGGFTTRGYTAKTDDNAKGQTKGHEKDATTRGTGTARVEYVPASGISLYAAARGDAVNQDYDNTPDDEQSWKQSRTWRGSTGGEVRIERFQAGVDAAHTLGLTDYEGGYEDVYRSDEDYLSAHLGYDLLTPGTRRSDGIDRFTIAGGVDNRREQARIDSSNLDESADQTGVWGQGLVGSKWIEGSLTGRVDKTAEDGTEPTFRAGLGVFPVRQMKIHGSVATGFRAPSLYELYAPAPYPGALPTGNPDLEAQRTTGFDLGHDTELPAELTLSNVWFRTDYRQSIEFALTGTNPVDPFEGFYDNTGPYRVAGVENLLNWRDGLDGWRIGLTYTFQHTSLGESDVAGGRGFTQLPRHKASLRPGWYGDRWRFVAQIDGASKRIAFAGEELEGYATLGANVGYQLTRETELYLRGVNLTQTHYELAQGYATQPLTVYAGMAMGF